MLQDPLTNWKLVMLYTIKDILYPPVIQMEIQFSNFKFSTLHSAVLDNTQNGKFRKVNSRDLYLANPVVIPELENIPINNFGRKAKLLYTEESCQIYSGRGYNRVQKGHGDLFSQLRLVQSPVHVSHCLEKFLVQRMLVNHQNWFQQSFTLIAT